jgi:AcrR family transcriptional regulator
MVTTPQPATAPLHAPPTLRNRATRAVRAEIAAVAMRLFLEQGFEKTTVEQIAAEAGLSRTSFFRYFAAKEDVVLGHLEELGQRVLDGLTARPAAEPAWEALRHAFDLLIEEGDVLPEQGLTMSRMLHDTPSLKARQLGKQLGWQDLLAPEVARRLGIPSEAPDPRPRAMVAAALGCLNAAADVWTATGGAVPLPDLLDQAMSALTRLGAPARSIQQ